MPTYFGPIAPYCPVSRDSPIGPSAAPTIRTMVPHVQAHDLASALAAVNILRTIVTQLVFDKTINNVFTPPPPKIREQPPDQFYKRTRTSRWSLMAAGTVKRKYKYYFKDKDGTEDREVWVMTERLEQMMWYDRGWKTTLAFNYGDKGEGELVGGGGAGTTGQDTGGE